MPDLGQLFDYQFMVNALEAGGVVAVMAAVVGWFMVVRRQTFAGHTLSVIGPRAPPSRASLWRGGTTPRARWERWCSRQPCAVAAATAARAP